MSKLMGLIADFPMPAKLAIFAGIAITTHLIVISIRSVASHYLKRQTTLRFRKLQSIGTLATSGLVFTLYFLALGLILQEFGVSLTAYLASASVVGLAIGFGSQGVVQDVVTGLTLIFSDLLDVGDLVEVSGQTGLVRAITMRFVELENAMGAAVFIPNRTITNITNYPRGYVRCIVDVTLRGEEARRGAAEAASLELLQSVNEQFSGIFITQPSSEGRIKLKSGKELLRLKFRIWPNRGQPVETAFNNELVAKLRRDDPDYQPWMVAITYEVEQKRQRTNTGWLWRRGGREPRSPAGPGLGG